MTVQIINITYTDVFKHYSQKYKIFRELLEIDTVAVEIRKIPLELAESVRNLVLSHQEICFTEENSDASLNMLFLGSRSVLKELGRKIKAFEDEGLGLRILNLFENILLHNNLNYTIGSKEFLFDKPYVVGILNVTPDSFSDGGKYFEKEEAIAHAQQMIDEGVDIIDIGGESTRPGAEKVDAEVEIKRTLPVIEETIKNNPNAIISIDTTKSVVADAALSAGSSIVNDISGMTFDPEMIQIVKKHDAAPALMHIQGTPQNMQKSPFYNDVVAEVYDYLSLKVENAKKSGIKNIIIDPGIGFGKTVEHNFELLRRLDEFTGIGCPILVGLSRKSFIGKALNLATGERDTPTAVSEMFAVQKGARLIRTHNYKNAIQLKNMFIYFNKPDLMKNV